MTLRQDLITEKHLKRLFTAPAEPTPSKLFLILDLSKFIFLYIVFFLLIYGLLNLPALTLQVKYSYKVTIRNQTFAPPAWEKNVEENSADNKIAAELPKINIIDNTLYIAKTDTEAPVIFNVEAAQILNYLEKGVVHFKGTALPGEKGNVFITGHSSNYPWRQSPYNTVFALLDKLEKKDQIALVYQNKKYLYEVAEVFTVKPKDVWVMQETEEPVLTLMTCYPLGTNLKRLIVRAKQIDAALIPAPKTTPTSPSTPLLPKLPGF
ncbi:sortase [Candidatus Berkelbacteria bacterium]|nr:sortase [Candidatus Berkelbacteria bacterium]